MQTRSRRTRLLVVGALASALIVPALASASVTPANAAAKRAPAAIKIGTYNIQKDSLRSWAPRRAKVVSLLRSANADAFGIQEANGPHKGSNLKFPGRDIDAQLGDYSVVKTRKDYKGNPDYSTTGRYIFYKPTRLTPARNGELALGKKQYAVWSEMTDRVTGQRFMLVNAHLINGNTAARDRVRRAQTTNLVAGVNRVNTNRLPTVMVGDFNSHKDHVSNAPTKVLAKNGWTDSYKVARKASNGSYNSNNQLKRKPPRKYMHADYVYVPRTATVVNWSQSLKLTNKKFKGVIPSDHNPVFATVVLR